MSTSVESVCEWIFTVFEEKESLSDFYDNINRFYPTINCITEIEKHNNTPFLDVMCLGKTMGYCLVFTGNLYTQTGI